MSRPPRGGRGLKFISEVGADGYRRRPPRGGRGLKYFNNESADVSLVVALLAEGVD